MNLSCNRCWVKFQPNIKFYLSECGHIFCVKCVQKTMTSNRCLICKKATVVIEIGKDMKESTQMFFWPMNNIFDQYLKIFSFQAMHRSMFAQAVRKKYFYAKKECIRYYTANKKIKQDIELLRQMLKSTKENPTLLPFGASYKPNSEPRPGRAQQVGNPHIYLPQNNQQSLAPHYQQGPATNSTSPVHGSVKRSLQHPTFQTLREKYESLKSNMYPRK